MPRKNIGAALEVQSVASNQPKVSETINGVFVCCDIKCVLPLFPLRATRNDGFRSERCRRNKLSLVIFIWVKGEKNTIILIAQEAIVQSKSLGMNSQILSL